MRLVGVAIVTFSHQPVGVPNVLRWLPGRIVVSNPLDEVLGLSSMYTKIDKGFNGELFFSLYNSGVRRRLDLSWKRVYGDWL